MLIFYLIWIFLHVLSCMDSTHENLIQDLR
jgi:hypothetical protein